MVGGLLGKRAGRSRLTFCGFSLSFPLCFSVFCEHIYIYLFKICSMLVKAFQLGGTYSSELNGVWRQSEGQGVLEET